MNIEEENTKLKEELARLKAGNEGKIDKLRFKIGPKGGLSVSGFKQKFPVTLYKNDWRLLLREENVDKILHFINEHDSDLK